MSLPLHDLAQSEQANSIVRLTANGLEILPAVSQTRTRPALIPERPLQPTEQYRFHFDMTKCIGCRSCEVACNEQNGNPADLRWRRIGEIEGGTYPDTVRHYLSMGCNHCLDADCIKGCPVDAYTKDPITGIVLHSADACIGCQYCVWNCPYSVPQFNPERGVVGKCDMCHGRLEEGLEPACVQACPENAIQIEIVDKLAWRADYALADSPGMPSAGLTISTTRITQPQTSTVLDRVDSETLHPEHPHWSLVWMTMLIQLAVGSLVAVVGSGNGTPVVVTLLLALTAFALNIAVLHLGRPAYAWRALKMWRRSWLSREVLLFLLFSLSSALLVAATWMTALHIVVLPAAALFSIRLMAACIGIAGLVASAYIYLVPARPAWNTPHTTADFLLSAGFLGSAGAPVLLTIARGLLAMPVIHKVSLGAVSNAFPHWPLGAFCLLWLGNQAVRVIRLHHSNSYERHATVSLLMSPGMRGILAASLALPLLSLFFAGTQQPFFAMVAACVAILCSRYLFFVSVVPLNMALTFVRSAHA